MADKINMNTSKVSIIAPIYNVSKYIECCAISLFEQTFTDIQFVFVNDCTTDNSIEILLDVINRYPNRKNSVEIVNHETNKGLASARNTGFKHAVGEYILHIDSDDYLELNMVEEMYTKAKENNADIVVCDFFMQWNSKQKYFKQNYAPSGLEYTKMVIGFEVMPNVWNKLINKDLIDRSGVSSVPNINTGEDYLLISKLSYHSTTIAKVDKALYHYNQLNLNSYMKTFSKKSITNLIMVLELLSEYFANKTDFNQYSKALLIGKLRVKIQMLQASSRQERTELLQIFPETNAIASTTTLKLQGKITIWLAKKKHILLLDFFIFVYRYLYNLKNIMTGRI